MENIFWDVKFNKRRNIDMIDEVRRITAEELRRDGYLLGFLNKNINKKGSGRIQRTLLESEVPLSLDEILEIAANSDEGKSLIEEGYKKGGRNPFDINNPTNRGIKVIEYFTKKDNFYKDYPAIGLNAEGKYYLTKISDFPELSETRSPDSNQQSRKKKSDYEYLPTKGDCERVIKNLSDSISENETDLEELFVELEKDLTEKGKTLKSNWKMITEENLKHWSK